MSPIYSPRTPYVNKLCYYNSDLTMLLHLSVNGPLLR
jgi:hypothetical protein